MPTATWVPCESPDKPKPSKTKVPAPWFASAEHYAMEFFRADGKLYACVTNEGPKPKGGGSAFATGDSQWYLIERGTTPSGPKKPVKTARTTKTAKATRSAKATKTIKKAKSARSTRATKATKSRK